MEKLQEISKMDFIYFIVRLMYNYVNDKKRGYVLMENIKVKNIGEFISKIEGYIEQLDSSIYHLERMSRDKSFATLVLKKELDDMSMKLKIFKESNINEIIDCNFDSLNKAIGIKLLEECK